MFIWNPLKKSEIFVNLWIYVLCISHIFYSHPIQVSSSFFLSFYLLVYWLRTSQHVEDECCDLQRETLWSPYLFLISRRPSRIQSPVGRSETRPTCPRAVVPLFDSGLRQLEWEGFLVAFQEKRFYFLIINNYLLRICSPPQHCKGGSRFFLGGGALVSCSTSTTINQIVFFAEYQLY